MTALPLFIWTQRGKKKKKKRVKHEISFTCFKFENKSLSKSYESNKLQDFLKWFKFFKLLFSSWLTSTFQPSTYSPSSVVHDTGWYGISYMCGLQGYFVPVIIFFVHSSWNNVYYFTTWFRDSTHERYHSSNTWLTNKYIGTDTECKGSKITPHHG